MKKIEAVIRHFTLDDVKNALSRQGSLHGMTIAWLFSLHFAICILQCDFIFRGHRPPKSDCKMQKSKWKTAVASNHWT